MARTDLRLRVAYNTLLDVCAALVDAAPSDAPAVLPSETELARQAAVSRTVVRAALRRLSDEGILRWAGRDKTLLRRPGPGDRLALTVPAGGWGADELEARFFDWVLRFDVAPGTALNVAQLSRQFAVPTHTIQEFLSGLSRFGLVERRARGGWTLNGFTDEFAQELFDFRALLELNAVRHLVTLPSTHPVWPRLDALRADHVALDARIETDFHDFSRLDQAFHATITAAVRNRFVAEFQKIISLIFHYHYNWNKTDEKARNRAAISEHLALIDALETRDADAAVAAAARHLATARATLTTSMQRRLG